MFRRVIVLGLFAFHFLGLLVGCENKSGLHNDTVYWILTHNNLKERVQIVGVNNPIILRETDTLFKVEDYLRNWSIGAYSPSSCNGVFLNSHEEAPLGPLDYVSMEDRSSYNETSAHVDDPHDIGLVLSSGNINKLKYIGSLVYSNKFRTSVFERLFEGGSNFYLINHKKNRILSCAFLGSLTARIESRGEFDGYQYYYTILDDGVFHLFYYGKTDFIEDVVLEKPINTVNKPRMSDLYDKVREAYTNDKEMKVAPIEVSSYRICDSGEIKVLRR